MNRVKIGAWNVHGLGKKLREEDCVNFVNSLDFVALLETWTTARSSINCSDYGSVHQYRRKPKRRGRPHGGILFLYKSKYNGFVEKQPSDHEDLLILKIKKEAIGHVTDLYIFVVYVKPVSETQSMFDVIERNLEKYSQHGDTVILGDLNARTGHRSDVDSVTANVDVLHLPDDVSQSCDNVPSRQTCDSVVNERGRELLDLCKTTDHVILNGRFLGDSMGYFTFMNDNGCSVVDYALVGSRIFDHVEYFKVSPLIHLSDHCAIETCLSFNNIPNWRTVDNLPMTPHYGKFMCNTGDKEMYCINLLSNESSDNICEFLSQAYSGDLMGVDNAVLDFQNIVTNAAKATFRHKVPRPNKPRSEKQRKKAANKWYDEDARWCTEEFTQAPEATVNCKPILG